MTTMTAASAAPPSITPRPVGVIIAAKSFLLGKALTALVWNQPRLKLLAHCGSPGALAEAVERQPPDILLLDEAMAARFAAGPGARVLVVSHRDHPGPAPEFEPDLACVFVGASAGAMGVTEALQKIADCPHLHAEAAGRCRDCILRRTLEPQALPLSPREYQVFERIGAGIRGRAIASELGCAPKTVDVHRENIKAKLGLDSALALHAAALAWRRGEYILEDRP